MRAAFQRVYLEGIIMILLSLLYVYTLLQQQIDLIVVVGCCCLLYLRWGISYFTTLRRLIRGELRRQALLARLQEAPGVWTEPILSSRNLPLPCTLQARLGPLFYLTIVLNVVGGIFAWFDWSLFVGIFGWVGYLLLFAFLIGLFVSVGFALNSLEVHVQRLEVSEDGLGVRRFFRRQTILWQDARLFTIDPICRIDKRADRYELTSTTTILRWRQPQLPSRFIVYSRPFQDYSRLLEAMREYIAIRAGLPLYDLRVSPSTSASSSLAEDSLRR